jgi:hypothetical protein
VYDDEQHLVMRRLIALFEAYRMLGIYDFV